MSPAVDADGCPGGNRGRRRSRRVRRREGGGHSNGMSALATGSSRGSGRRPGANWRAVTVNGVNPRDLAAAAVREIEQAGGRAGVGTGRHQ